MHADVDSSDTPPTGPKNKRPALFPLTTNGTNAARARRTEEEFGSHGWWMRDNSKDKLEPSSVMTAFVVEPR